MVKPIQFAMPGAGSPPTKCGLMRFGGNRSSGAVEDALANTLFAFGGLAGFSDLIILFANLSQADDHLLFFLFVGVSHLKAQLITGLLAERPAVRAFGWIRIVPSNDFVPRSKHAFGRRRIRVNSSNYQRRVRFAFRQKSKDGTRGFVNVQLQSRKAEHFLIWQRFNSGDIVDKEIFEGAAGDSFGGKADIEAVAIELPFLGEFGVHGA